MKSLLPYMYLYVFRNTYIHVYVCVLSSKININNEKMVWPPLTNLVIFLNGVRSILFKTLGTPLYVSTNATCNNISIINTNCSYNAIIIATSHLLFTRLNSSLHTVTP